MLNVNRPDFCLLLSFFLLIFLLLFLLLLFLKCVKNHIIEKSCFQIYWLLCSTLFLCEEWNVELCTVYNEPANQPIVWIVFVFSFSFGSVRFSLSVQWMCTYLSKGWQSQSRNLVYQYIGFTFKKLSMDNKKNSTLMGPLVLYLKTMLSPWNWMQQCYFVVCERNTHCTPRAPNWTELNCTVNFNGKIVYVVT